MLKIFGIKNESVSSDPNCKPRLGSMIFSVLLAPGNAARCNGNGKQGMAGVAVESPGAMDSKGGRNRGQNAMPAVTATARTARADSRHLRTMACFGVPGPGDGTGTRPATKGLRAEKLKFWSTLHLLHECVSCHHLGVRCFGDPGNPGASKIQ